MLYQAKIRSKEFKSLNSLWYRWDRQKFRALYEKTAHINFTITPSNALNIIPKTKHTIQDPCTHSQNTPF